jgi:DinB superfamily
MSDFLGDTRDLLRRSPDVLRALLTGLPDTWTTTPDVADGWRPRDVVGHLISAELDDWIPRTQRILEHGTAKAFDPFDRFAHVERDINAPLDALIDRFAELRADNLATVDALATDDNLDSRGLHPSLGAVTLRELLATWAVHDLDHVSQIYAGIAGAYDAEVGPWKAYLGILLRRDDPAAVPG